MATQTTNRISVDISPDEVNKAKECINMISGMFPFLVGLTPAERQALPKMDVNNKVFVEDALKSAHNNKQILPAYLSLDEMERDRNGYERLDELVILTAQLAQKLRDTQILMGSEAYVSALTIYRLFESASRDGVPGADAVYSQLASRFKGQGSIGETPAVPEAPKEA